MGSWNCPKCNFNNMEDWKECNSCWTSKPVFPITQEDRIKTLEKLKYYLETAKSLNSQDNIYYFEDKVKKQEDVVKKHQREYNLSKLLGEKTN